MTNLFKESKELKKLKIDCFNNVRFHDIILEKLEKVVYIDKNDRKEVLATFFTTHRNIVKNLSIEKFIFDHVKEYGIVMNALVKLKMQSTYELQNFSLEKFPKLKEFHFIVESELMVMNTIEYILNKQLHLINLVLNKTSNISNSRKRMMIQFIIKTARQKKYKNKIALNKKVFYPIE